ncbi:MAG: GH36-type glycosyl hydrolase domain-containing protein [Armatimonadota bacterium]
MIISALLERHLRLREGIPKKAPIRDVLLGPEELDQCATDVAILHKVSTRPQRASRLLASFEEDYRFLHKSLREIAGWARAGAPLIRSAEWLLDNSYLIQAQAQQIRQNLPQGFYRELPKLVSEPLTGYPRVYAIAIELISHTNAQLNEERLTRFVNAYQRETSLTSGEVWALPIMCQIAIILNLQRLSSEIVSNQRLRAQANAWADRVLLEAQNCCHTMTQVLARHDRQLEKLAPAHAVQLLQRFLDQGPSAACLVEWLEERLGRQGTNIDDVTRLVHQEEAANVTSVSNCIATLRFIGGYDWPEFFEQVSRIEQILRTDPDGTYPRMDFATRDSYRHEVERLAKVSKIVETHVARHAVKLASEAVRESNTPAERQHLGYYLFDRGKDQLTERLRLRKTRLQRLCGNLGKHPTALYLVAALTATMLLTGLFTLLGVRNAGVLSASAWVLLPLLLLIPSSEMAIQLLNRLVTRLVPPRLLPKLELKDGLPPELHTMVVIQTMLSTSEHIVEMVERMEVCYLANQDQHLHFALLSDFFDAARETLPGDDALLEQAQEEVAALNARYPTDRPVFYLFHRRRIFNAAHGAWMGWERKRGKLEEFNRMLRGDNSTSFVNGPEEIAALSPVRYVVTLDEDTQLPRQAVRRLVGSLAHPLNRPRLNDQRTRVIKGYGVLQPRVSVTPETTGRSVFASTFAGQGGVDPYPTAVSDVYQDLFGEGIYMGKGIYEVDAFIAVLDGQLPENAVLSHDLLEGGHVRAGAVTDVEVVDGFPAAYLAAARRMHRWVRGDWQLLPWLLPQVRKASGEFVRNPLRPISRWKILDNLRRSLVAPALFLLLFLGLTVLPGSPGLWLAVALLGITLPIIVHLADDTMANLRLCLKGSLTWFLPDLGLIARQVVLCFVQLAHHAYLISDAVVRTLVRLLVTHRLLLEWETAATVERCQGRTPASYLAQMWPASALGAALAVLAVVASPDRLPWVAPVAALWIVSPLVAWWISQPERPRISTLTAQDSRELTHLAEKTWRYFAERVGAGDNDLPPDNYQESAEPGEHADGAVIAHRTSPTNIGMYLLSVLTARDFGFITPLEMLERIERTLASVESLPLHQGHLYNWYDTETLAPLSPRYVSTADSGNLAASLLVLKQGIGELVDLPAHTLRVELALDAQDASAAATVERYRQRCRDVVLRLESFGDAMDFSFLYDLQRHLFVIGYHVDSERTDSSYYDLLASEARIASFVAIAKGDVPEKHWFRLGRGMRQLSGRRALASWNGTMFEYLMPLLMMRKFAHTLLDETYTAVVQRQREYGQHHGLPWGVSESGFCARDLNFNYQYYAFGVPSLGLRRALSSDKVVAPYATMLALAVDPALAMRNVRTLIGKGMEGRYGLYEAMDYTPERLQPGQRYEIVRSFMAHHQGMSLVAINNALNGNVMQERFHSERMVQATELLLQEKLPRRATSFDRSPAEEKRPYRAITPVDVPIMRHFATPHTTEPEGHILSNGTYSVLLTTTGAGFSRCGKTAITRWREDFTQDHWGMFFYIRDLTQGHVWSATYQPLGGQAATPATQPEIDSAIFAAERVEFIRRVEDIESHLEVVVSPEHNAEVRRLSLSNHGRESRQLDLISYLEVVLGPAAADLDHPAFSNLFVETEFIADRDALLCTRRPRTPEETPPYLIHVVACERKSSAPTRCETDRSRFVGRGRTSANPLMLDLDEGPSGTVGAVLDPILSLCTTVSLGPGETVQVAFTTALAETREEALQLISLYHTVIAVERAFVQAWTHSQLELRHMRMTIQQSHLLQQLASRMCYPGISLQTRRDMIARNRKGQPGLWGLGISGDHPILLVRISREEELDLVRDALQAHQFMRLKGLVTDLVIVNEHRTEYTQVLQEQIRAQIEGCEERPLENQPGGVFSHRSEAMSEDERVLLQAVALVTLSGAAGSLKRQLASRLYALSLPRVLVPEHALLHTLSRVPAMAVAGARRVELHKRLPELPLAERFRRRRLKEAYPAPPVQPRDLLFFNGLGGFTPDAHEYHITVHGEQQTPAPWINVLANADFGCLVSESGSGCTWSLNSRENRLTPWSNDAVSDPPGEVVYLRDEETGEFWTSTPLPIREPEPYVIRHGQGYSVFEHHSHGLDQELLLFVPTDAPVKIYRLRVRNESPRRRSLSATFYAEWVLGVQRERSRQFIVTDVDLQSGIHTATNAYREEAFASRLGFVDVVGVPSRTMTSDRTEFIGRNGRLSAPAALFRVALSGRMGAGYDPCGACQVKFSLAAGETTEVLFVLGEAGSIEEARALAERFRTPGEAETALREVRDYWNNVLRTLQVQTPEPALDLLLNRWLLYQTISSRLWARAAFYQSGGAYGFRDQLQDVMALVYAAPYMTREQILRAASRQYLEGDVQHWWHMPTGLGVRTRCSDDYVWLPYVIADYVTSTGDSGVLDEPVSYLQDRPLAPEEGDRANVPEVSPVHETLYQHGVKALHRAVSLVGEHGLPLMGSGDWNDSMNLVGDGGRGESVWLGWFLATALNRFAPLCEGKGDEALATHFRSAATSLVAAIEKEAWDGDWYRRAYTDDGVPLGTAQGEECRIDAISQSWAVISGAGAPERARQGMEAVDQQLVKRLDRLMLLLTPPFEKSPLEPGYIKGYVPGVRENGGQYTHAATWTVMATALLGDGDRAAEYFGLINPINHARTPEEVAQYRVEPYAVAADIYGAEPHTGRGGWTWYTGSSAWMYRVAMEGMLGLRLDGGDLFVDPCLPRHWSGFTVTNHFFSTTYEITVENPEGLSRGVAAVWLDGESLPDGRIRRVDDGATHRVRVLLGGAV